MDGATYVSRQFTEEHMDAKVWIELVIVVLRIIAAGMAG
jgi:hypothetical protein